VARPVGAKLAPKRRDPAFLNSKGGSEYVAMPLRLAPSKRRRRSEATTALTTRTPDAYRLPTVNGRLALWLQLLASNPNRAQFAIRNSSSTGMTAATGPRVSCDKTGVFNETSASRVRVCQASAGSIRRITGRCACGLHTSSANLLDGGDRPGLQKEEAADLIERPLDVLRAPLNFLQLPPESRQSLQLGLVQHLLSNDLATLDCSFPVQ
jgi:hypothetical protein